MKRLLIDTNIIVDLLTIRGEFYLEAAELFSHADRKELTLLVSSLSFANSNYILLKQKSGAEAKEILRKFRLIVDVVDLSSRVVDWALNDHDFTDFEDALQYYSAIEVNADVIISRNKKDFKFSKIPVLTAGEFLAKRDF